MKIIRILLVFISFTLFAQEQEKEARFFEYPDIHKNKIVFSFMGDLYTADTSGSNVKQLTSLPGEESFAVFSPDGGTIAFAAQFEGGYNVYLIPTDSGKIERLTFNPGGGIPVQWKPDGEYVVFKSYMQTFIYRDPKLFQIKSDGTAPSKLPPDRGTRATFKKAGDKMYYCRKGREEYYWKRYKGGQYQDIWKYDFTTNEYAPVTDYVGKNSYPMLLGGELYFVSDRTNGIANLYKMDLDSKKAEMLTEFDDVDLMMAGFDDEQIVFVNNGYIKVYNPEDNSVRKITLNVESDKFIKNEKTINPKDYIHSMEISPTGKYTVVDARGDIFLINNEDNSSINLSNSPGTRERYPVLSPDEKFVAFFSDSTGEYQLYLQNIDSTSWVQLTSSLHKTVYHPVWSPDGSRILFGDKDFTLFYFDLENDKLKKIDDFDMLKNDQFYWEISDYQWSPDGKWITYSVVNYNRNSSIKLYSVEQDKIYDVTDDFFDNLNPSFDKNGKYLYYLSSRNFDVVMDFYEDNHVLSAPYRVMAVQLYNNMTPPFSEPVMVSEGVKRPEPEYNPDNLTARTYPLPAEAGDLFFLKAANEKLLWCSVDEFTTSEYEEIFQPGGRTKWTLHGFDMNTGKEIVFPEKIARFELSSNGEHVLINADRENYYTRVDSLFATETFGEKVVLDSMKYNIDYREEWRQIFSDTWRWYRDFFYDENMHGLDWDMLGERYLEYVDDIYTRGQLNWVLQQMVGELSVSHTYIWGGDTGPREELSSDKVPAVIAADIIADEGTGYYQFAKIYGPTKYNLSLEAPLSRPDIDLKEGDYLIAVNGKPVRVPDNFYKLMMHEKGDTITLTVNSKPHMDGAVEYKVAPIRSDRSLRYFRWISDNIDYVLEKTNGKVGYLHITAMGSGGIAEFDKFWRAFRYKDGIILDLRRNSGGWTEYFMIDKLERKQIGYNVLQGMVPYRYPNSAGSGNYVVVSNEYNGSDGELFVQHFQERELGTVVGTPSWGGLVGIINAQKTIDMGTVHQSNNAFYGKDGTWFVENHGAEPDIYIDNDPGSVAEGRDKQLDKAIEVMLKTIEKDTTEFPPVPGYPDRNPYKKKIEEAEE